MERHSTMASNAIPPPALPASTSLGDGSDSFSLNIVTYNLNDLIGHGHLVLTELCSTVSNMGVIFLQEHCLTPANMTQLQNFDPLFSAFGISGMEKKISMGLLKGRPFGGRSEEHTSELQSRR